MAARRREAKRWHWPANLYQNSTGYFYWRNPDTKKDYGIGRDQAKAFGEARAANAELEQSRGHRSIVQRMTAPDDRTLRAWSAEYAVIYAETRNPTPSTMKTVRAGIRAVCTAPFVDRLLREVKTSEVADFILTATTARGAPMAALIRKTMHDMFREAETKGLIEGGKNPVSVTRRPDIEVVRSRLTLENFLAIYKQAQKSPDPWIARSMELALITAQRREDVSKMQFAEAKDGFLAVVQTKGRGSVRLRIPLSLRLGAIKLSLDDVVKRCRDDAVSAYMLHYTETRGGQRRSARVTAEKLTRAFADTRNSTPGLTWEDGRTPASFHEIRSLAARLYTEQYDAKFAQALLGHKSAEMTSLYRDVRGAEWTELKIAI
ncbi:tyrosine-type recombinase/integrase [Caballeronia sp. GAFFF2]|uniref:tyrosine-type recombinase/integrase n=1 Tax=Caballeronia sp. GAFFF2 TaxID=2921741 RepID=UPI00202893FF|nr:tyrosine-type recombinase/integrase [Caballeronia sp. GAFFF2]